MNELRTLTSLAVPDVPIDHRYFAEKWTVGAPGDRTLKLQPPKFTKTWGVGIIQNLLMELISRWDPL